jgi:hypothetical protein
MARLTRRFPLILCKEVTEPTRTVAGMRSRNASPSTRPTAAQRGLWHSRSDLLAGWLMDHWKREQAQRDEGVRRW